MDQDVYAEQDFIWLEDNVLLVTLIQATIQHYKIAFVTEDFMVTETYVWNVTHHVENVQDQMQINVWTVLM